MRVIVAENSRSLPTLSYKHLDFEMEPEKAHQFRKNFQNLIDLCNSPYLTQYNQIDKKTSTKWSRSKYNSKEKDESKS